MILSKKQIEEIAMGVIYDFREVTGINEVFTPIDQVAKDYLNLDVLIAKLSDDGSVCGLTAYDDTKLQYQLNGQTVVLPLKKNQIVLDSSFIAPGKVKTLCGKRRFTLAHEIAHQVLFSLAPDTVKINCRKLYSERKTYTAHELKTHEDWNEWQANALGAAILMPRDSVSIFMNTYNLKNEMTAYNGKLYGNNKVVFDSFCCYFKVSKSAAQIRLKELGYLREEKRELLEIVCDE